MLEGMYIITAIVGWTLVALSSIFGGDTDFDLDADMDLDLDMDVDLDFEGPDGLDIDGIDSGFDAIGETLMGMLSIRSLLYFAAGFGGAGLLMTWLIVT